MVNIVKGKSTSRNNNGDFCISFSPNISVPITFSKPNHHKKLYTFEYARPILTLTSGTAENIVLSSQSLCLNLLNMVSKILYFFCVLHLKQHVNFCLRMCFRTCGQTVDSVHAELWRLLETCDVGGISKWMRKMFR